MESRVEAGDLGKRRRPSPDRRQAGKCLRQMFRVQGDQVVKGLDHVIVDGDRLRVDRPTMNDPMANCLNPGTVPVCIEPGQQCQERVTVVCED